MHIENLSLIGFKNYDELSLTFSPNINCIVGPNGSGKTNILDAIYYLSMTKGAHNSIDSQNIKFGQPFFSIQGKFDLNDETNDVVCYFQEGTKKSFKVNKKDYEKLSQHIGRFPSVLIAPNDSDIIRDGSEIRRRFFDSILCQLDSEYLSNLLKYNYNLRQRNSLLKQFNRSQKIDYDLLEKYNQYLIQYGQAIYVSRSEFTNRYLDYFKEQYAVISSEKEKVDITYASNFAEDNFDSHLKEAIPKDIKLERTTLGIHKDEYNFLIEEKPLKKYGSQGQQKSFSIALKLAQFHYLFQGLERKPLLLLDDIFDKLDAMRIKKLLKLVVDDTFGQVFITDALEDRTRNFMKEFGLEANFIVVADGEVR